MGYAYGGGAITRFVTVLSDITAPFVGRPY